MPKPWRRSNTRGQSLVRVLTVARRLKQAPQTYHGLAQELECCPRTVQRDIEMLQELHAPIVKTTAGWLMRGEWI